MRTVIKCAPVYERCGHCSLPDALHTHEQRMLCERRLLADVSRSWPRTAPSPAERVTLMNKRIQAALLAITKAMQVVELSADERAKIHAAAEVLGTHIARIEAA